MPSAFIIFRIFFSILYYLLDKFFPALIIFTFSYFLEQINKDAAYNEISKARFPALPWSLRSRLNCDLYELDEEMLKDIEKTVWRRDSIIHADTLSQPPPETFLQMLYRRKMRIMLASQPDEDANTSNNVPATTTSVRQ